MLVLARKLGQAIRIPDLNITIRVLQTRPGRVHLGLEVPAGLRIMRQELLPDPPDHRDAGPCPQTIGAAAPVAGA